ncbi:hypothetical protein AB4175_16335 [Vibrio cyclitrophicus]
MTTFTKQTTGKTPRNFHQVVTNKAIEVLNVSMLDSNATTTKEISKKDQQLAKRYLKNLKVNFTSALRDGDNPHGFSGDLGVCDIVFDTSLNMGRMGCPWNIEYHQFVTGTSNSLLSGAINELLKLHNVNPNSTALNFPIEAVITKSDDGNFGTWEELEELFYDPENNNFQGDALKIRIQLMNIFVIKFREWFEIVW